MTAIKNILFDLGGVLYHIDYELTIKAFKKLGIKNFHEHFSQQQQNNLFDRLETGKINDEDFIKEMKALLPHCTRGEIINAWNALLIGIPQENIQLLKDLSKQYRLFLLSNTNAIHINQINKLLYKNYNLKSLDPLFDKIYLSHQIGIRKPNSETFEWVLKDARILAQETLFIEDSLQHIKSAKELGIQTRLWRSNEPFKSFFLDKAL
ncbi:HAD family phosphatase [Flavobacteriales bacterium]|nr:HAD family phosphatase [Flavobacteriales bacterium]